MGPETLREIGEDSIHLLDTSVAIYEKNGDYAFGMFSSGWCRLMHQASRDLCETEDNREALSCGKWLCHENCWNDSAKPAILTGKSTDIACVGGIRLYAEPIFAEGKVVGAINIGYGTPPKDPETIEALSAKFRTDEASLVSAAGQYEGRPAFVITAAKRRLRVLARLIGTIVEKHLMERESRAERERLDRILSSLDTGLSLINRDLTIAWVNDKTRAMFPGTEPEGSVCHLFFEGREAPCDACPTMEAFETGKIVRADRRHEINRRWFNIISQPIYGPTGDVSQVLEGITDVTERKRLEEALRKSEELYRTLYDSIRDAILVADTERKIIHCNPAFEDLFGYTLEEIRGKKTHHVYDSEEEFRRIGEAIRENLGNPRFLYTINYRKKSGEAFPGETNVFYLKDDQGDVTGFIGLIRDITERRRAEEERERMEARLRQAHKMEAVGRLAGGVAHDFNSMLNVILGYSEMCIKDASGTYLHQPLMEIKQAAERSSDLVRQLLAFSRKQLISPRVVDLNERVKDKLNMLDQLMGEGVKLRFRPDPDLWRVRIDTSQLDQVLTNLALNARDAMPRGGELIIETANVTLGESYSRQREDADPGDYVLMSFSDTGRGMPPEALEQVFEPFFTTKDVSEGTGMGLATVYGIIKQHGGTIHVHSEPGKGTTFKIHLPRFNGEEARPAKEEKTAAFSGTETVLVVEDEAQVLKLAKKILERNGYTVLAADNAEEALRVAGEYEGEIHLLLSDVVMPGMNGKELDREVKRIRPGIKTLFMSGYTANVIAQRGLADKGVGLLQKPFSVDDLTGKIREVLDS